MCMHLIQVAEESNQRTIFCCEHGTFHLSWDRALFYLSLDELKYLHTFLGKEKISHSTHAKYKYIQFSDHTDANGEIYFELWIEEAGMRLFFEDCEMLKALLQEAVNWQKTQPSLTSQGHIGMAKDITNLSVKAPTHRKSYWN